MIEKLTQKFNIKFDILQSEDSLLDLILLPKRPILGCLYPIALRLLLLYTEAFMGYLGERFALLNKIYMTGEGSLGTESSFILNI